MPIPEKRPVSTLNCLYKGVDRMTKDVVITIVGSQSEGEIELTTVGNYYNKDDKHYVFYEETPDASSIPIKNKLIFDDKSFEMTKKGSVTSTMIFDTEKITQSTYQTPFGPIAMEVVTNAYELKEAEELMEMDIDYSLGLNSLEATPCHVYVKLEAK